MLNLYLCNVKFKSSCEATKNLKKKKIMFNLTLLNI